MKRSIAFDKPIAIIVVILTMVFTISSCSIKGYKAVSNLQEINITTLHIFNNDFQKALFKTEIKIYNQELTGITLIKKTDSAMRVVAMSEMGMKYFDFEFPCSEQGDAIVHYIMEPLDKKLLINMIIRDFSLLFYLPKINNSEVLQHEVDKSKILIKHSNLIYFLDNKSIITNIKRYRSIRPMKEIVSLKGYTNTNPNTIYFDHGNISFKFVEINN